MLNGENSAGGNLDNSSTQSVDPMSTIEFESEAAKEWQKATFHKEDAQVDNTKSENDNNKETAGNAENNNEQQKTEKPFVDFDNVDDLINGYKSTKENLEKQSSSKEQILKELGFESETEAKMFKLDSKIDEIDYQFEQLSEQVAEAEQDLNSKYEQGLLTDEQFVEAIQDLNRQQAKEELRLEGEREKTLPEVSREKNNIIFSEFVKENNDFIKIGEDGKVSNPEMLKPFSMLMNYNDIKKEELIEIKGMIDEISTASATRAVEEYKKSQAMLQGQKNNQEHLKNYSNQQSQQSNFNNQESKIYTREDLKAMSESEFLKNEKVIFAQMAKGLIK